MELFKKHILSECFVKGSEAHQRLKRIKKETLGEKDVKLAARTIWSNLDEKCLMD